MCRFFSLSKRFCDLIRHDGAAVVRGIGCQKTSSTDQSSFIHFSPRPSPSGPFRSRQCYSLAMTTTNVGDPSLSVECLSYILESCFSIRSNGEKAVVVASGKGSNSVLSDSMRQCHKLGHLLDVCWRHSASAATTAKDSIAQNYSLRHAASSGEKCWIVGIRQACATRNVSETRAAHRKPFGVGIERTSGPAFARAFGRLEETSKLNREIHSHLLERHKQPVKSGKRMLSKLGPRNTLYFYLVPPA